MIVRALDALNDWTFGRGRNNYLQRNAAIGQSAQTRLSSFLGDCFFEIAAGIDWFNLLGSKQRALLRLNIESVLLNTDGVTGIINLNIDEDLTRKISFQYELNTVYTGLLAPNGTVTGNVDFILTESGVTITTEDGDPITTGG